MASETRFIVGSCLMFLRAKTARRHLCLQTRVLRATKNYFISLEVSSRQRCGACLDKDPLPFSPASSFPQPYTAWPLCLDPLASARGPYGAEMAPEPSSKAAHQPSELAASRLHLGLGSWGEVQDRRVQTGHTPAYREEGVPGNMLRSICSAQAQIP